MVPLFKVAHDGVGLWTVVGRLGWVLTSPDAVTWAPTLVATDSLYGVAHDGAGLWTAVGASGGVLTSPDALSWTVRTSGTASDLRAIVHVS
jgi:hypothetical protein